MTVGMCVETMMELCIDRAALALGDPLSLALFPTLPHRLCTCGHRPDGSFIKECPACKRWESENRLLKGKEVGECIEVCLAELADARTESAQARQAYDAVLDGRSIKEEGVSLARKNAYQTLRRRQITVRLLEKRLNDLVAYEDAHEETHSDPRAA